MLIFFVLFFNQYVILTNVKESGRQQSFTMTWLSHLPGFLSRDAKESESNKKRRRERWTNSFLFQAEEHWKNQLSHSLNIAVIIFNVTLTSAFSWNSFLLDLPRIHVGSPSYYQLLEIREPDNLIDSNE